MSSRNSEKSIVPASGLKPQAWQAAFVESLFKGLSEPLTGSLATQTFNEQHERFAIYQNNVFYSLRAALAELYPTIKKLVGEEFFNGTADAYIRAYPPQQPAMVYFGLDFSDFLSQFKHTQNMAYLSDIASLEVARHKAYHASDVEILDKKKFAGIEATVFERSQLELHPSVQIISSIFPIFTIWQSNLDEANLDEANLAENTSDDEEIALNEPQWLIVVRCEYEVRVFNVDHGTYLFYHDLLNQEPVYNAAQHAQDRHTDFDISAAIVLGINNGFFTKLILND